MKPKGLPATCRRACPGCVHRRDGYTYSHGQVRIDALWYSKYRDLCRNDSCWTADRIHGLGTSEKQARSQRFAFLRLIPYSTLLLPFSIKVTFHKFPTTSIQEPMSPEHVCPAIHLDDISSFDSVTDLLPSHRPSIEDSPAQSKVSHSGCCRQALPAPSKFSRKARSIGGTSSRAPVLTAPPSLDAQMDSVMRSHRQYVFSLIIQDEASSESCPPTHDESRWDRDAESL